MKKHQDLTPFLDYFDLLKTYELTSYLEVYPEKHEAYVTRGALHTLILSDVPSNFQRLPFSVLKVVRCIRAYTGWRSQQGGDYLAQPFALHVVKDDAPHDLSCTFMLTYHRVWWKLWLGKADTIELITYSK